MKIALASDHRGFKIKAMLGKYLSDKGFSVVDFGTHGEESCDYPDYIYPAAKAVRNNEVARAIVICYTGIGSAIAANKVHGIRAALVYSLKSAILSRRHNDANVMVLPSYLIKGSYLKRVVLAWLKEGFEGGRHLARVEKIRKIEEKEDA